MFQQIQLQQLLQYCQYCHNAIGNIAENTITNYNPVIDYKTTGMELKWPKLILIKIVAKKWKKRSNKSNVKNDNTGRGND